MEKQSFFKWAIPIVIIGAIILIAHSLFSGDGGQGRERGGTPGQTAQPEKGGRKAWKCHACAQVPGKNFLQCKSITSTGTKSIARDEAKMAVCGEDLRACKITQLKCR